MGYQGWDEILMITLISGMISSKKVGGYRIYETHCRVKMLIVKLNISIHLLMYLISSSWCEADYVHSH